MYEHASIHGHEHALNCSLDYMQKEIMNTWNMTEIIEEIFSGYCKTKNATQSIICEYEQMPYGLSLLSVSCEFEKCQYNKDCTVVRQAILKEDE